LKVAWDATKLGVALKGFKKERALVEAKKNQVKVFTRKEASKELRRLLDEERYEELARCYLSDKIMDKAHDLLDLWWSIWDIYWLFLLFRFALVFMDGNSGYIHPDEYFQSLEVTVGDIFGLNVHRTWEFNTTQPLRSPSINYLIYGVPLSGLKVFNFVLHHYLGINIIGNFLLRLTPKLVLFLLSLVVDFLVYQVCKLYKHSYNQCLTTLASSYVMLVYSTRSFSNTLELVLTSLLMYLVAHSMKWSDETVYLQELVQEKYSKAETIRDRVEIHKKRKKIPAHDFKYTLPIGVICGLGIFNRPTFILYAFVPVFFWFQRGVANHSMFTPFQTFNCRVVVLIPVIIATSLCLIFTDSIYFGDITFKKLWHLSMNYTDWKVAPFNFVMYNLVPGNIVEHGEHPRYTHTLVNLPVLLGPLAPVFLLTVAQFFLDMCYQPWNKKPSVRTVYGLTLFSSLVPLACLSLFKHQEARFLLPILPSIILMASHKLRYKVLGYRPLLSLWYMFNIACVVWFGYVHQAGVLPVQRHLGGLKEDSTEYINLVYSHTYMPPRYPLLQPDSVNQDEFPAYILNNNTRYLVQDYGSIETEILHSRLIDLVSRSRYISTKQNIRMKTYLIIPKFLLDQLSFTSRSSLQLDVLYSRFPHVSVESLDKLDLDIYDDFGDVSVMSMMNGALRSLSGFSLDVVNVTLAANVKTVDIPDTSS